MWTSMLKKRSSELSWTTNDAEFSDHRTGLDRNGTHRFATAFKLRWLTERDVVMEDYCDMAY